MFFLLVIGLTDYPVLITDFQSTKAHHLRWTRKWHHTEAESQPSWFHSVVKITLSAFKKYLNRYFLIVSSVSLSFLFPLENIVLNYFYILNSLYCITLSFPQYNLLNVLSQPLKSINSKALHYLCNLFDVIYFFISTVYCFVFTFLKKQNKWFMILMKISSFTIIYPVLWEKHCVGKVCTFTSYFIKLI